ncbi:EcsC family protein [uncultured Litoreibacter sp.]|uniref:EcsC family protein n=1 Tax=uncultured Litoreibacter sp. TaxID=1392394 RepID=UPI00260F4686|nr:EcsC family protein [uncultured Litoreibacter sp.]
MTQTVLPPVVQPRPGRNEQLDALATRYRDAQGIGMQVVSLLGSQAEGLLDKLPKPARAGLNSATLKALELSFSAASASRGTLPDSGTWLTRMVTVTTGAAGGFGGLTTALAELPVTTTVILRAIQGIASDYGFDPADEDTRADCLRVFASAGPMAEDEGMDLSFLTLRASVTGATMQVLLSTVAPKLAVTLGKKLALQTVPVLGAVTGAAINYAFTSYYQDIAHVQFGLRKLAEETGEDRAALIAAFEARVSQA